MNNPDREKLFADAIDGRFPYADLQAAAALIAEARAISANAAFCVLYEISCPPHPREDHVTVERQRELLGIWADGFQHPLATPLLQCAATIIGDSPLATEQALRIMKDIGAFQGQNAALAIASAAAYVHDEELTRVDSLEELIRARWENEPHLAPGED